MTQTVRYKLCLILTMHHKLAAIAVVLLTFPTCSSYTDISMQTVWARQWAKTEIGWLS